METRGFVIRVTLRPKSYEMLCFRFAFVRERGRITGLPLVLMSYGLLRNPALVCVGVLCFLCGSCQEMGYREAPASALVGRLEVNRWILPTGQLLSPVGRQVELPGLRLQAIALSPDAHLLAIGSNQSNVSIVDTLSGTEVGKVPLPPEPSMKTIPSPGAVSSTDLTSTNKAGISLAGLEFSPDGSRIFYSNVMGSIKVFAVGRSHEVTPLCSFPLPPANAPDRQAEIPAGLAVSRDGRRLYVAGNLSNQLLELDAESGKVLRSWKAGVAPFNVRLVGGKAYVTNEGGRRPGSSDLVGPAGRATLVRVDERSIASDGSVTVVDLARGTILGEIPVGLHPTALAVSPDGRFAVAANSGSDTLSVIDTHTDRVVETIWAKSSPAELFGAQPCALAFDESGKRLYVCNGTQNAVAVIDFEPDSGNSRLAGLIPVAWFPASIAVDHVHHQLCVGNMRGLGSAKQFLAGEPVKLSTKDYFGTLSLVQTPSTRDLASLTSMALFDMRFGRLQEAKLPPRPAQSPRAVPERSGEPSVFHHVVYVIKENRTYDQVLGDMKEGHGDPALCTFGEEYTPNSHEISRQFILMDNTYCCGVSSADGHQWTDSALANPYEERQLTASSPRSYPNGKQYSNADALAYASSGFIWGNAVTHGKSFRNYGEWLISDARLAGRSSRPEATWLDFWHDFQEGGGRMRLACHPAIEALRPYSKLDTVGWDLRVPDLVRADRFIAELKEFETRGHMPDFILLYLPNDHTGGTRSGGPTPGAQVADNDLALGRVVDALSHSRFWADTCLFAIEDDPQSGWDHISGYRTTCYVASPYSRLRSTNSTRYNQLSVIRTMELILGLPPMNQLDAAATPMTDCFGVKADLTPYEAVPNRVPLDTMNPAPTALADPRQREDAIASARLPLDEPDKCDEDTLNRILWRAMRGAGSVYPAWAIAKTDDDDD